MLNHDFTYQIFIDNPKQLLPFICQLAAKQRLYTILLKLFQTNTFDPIKHLNLILNITHLNHSLSTSIFHKIYFITNADLIIKNKNNQLTTEQINTNISNLQTNIKANNTLIHQILIDYIFAINNH